MKQFMSRKDAAAYTGVSYDAIRKGTASGAIPCIRSGKKYLVNMLLWLEQLNRESRNQGEK